MNSRCSPGVLLPHGTPLRLLIMWVSKTRVVRDKPLLRCRRMEFRGAIKFLQQFADTWTPQIVDQLKSSVQPRRSPFPVPLAFLGDAQDLMLIYFRGRWSTLYNPLGNCELSCRLW